MTDMQPKTSGADWYLGVMPWAAYRQAGLTFAMRYIVPQIAGKMISSQEIREAHAADIDVGFIYETTGSTWTGGAQAGMLDGTAARLALASVEAPHSCAAYFTIDSQVPDDHLPLVMEYLDAAREYVYPYRCGIYGQYSVITEAASRFPDVYRWQTMAWSDGQQSHSADLLQGVMTKVGGVQIDLDVAYQPYFGQWYANSSMQPPSSEAGDMPSGFVDSGVVLSVPVIFGLASRVMLYADIGLAGNTPQHVRVAVHSQERGYSQITEETLDTNKPVTILFIERDVDGVSLSREHDSGDLPVGYTIG